jgi:hypothetical protein
VGHSILRFPLLPFVASRIAGVFDDAEAIGSGMAATWLKAVNLDDIEAACDGATC